MSPKVGLVPLALLALVTEVGAAAAHTPGGGGVGVGRESAWIYVLAVGTPVAVTLLFVGYVYLSTPKRAKAHNEGEPRKPRRFDYTEVDNQLVVTYEGEGSWDTEGLVVRCGGQGGEEEKVERFETGGDYVKKGDGVSVDADGVGGKVEVVWNGEVVDEHLTKG